MSPLFILKKPFQHFCSTNVHCKSWTFYCRKIIRLQYHVQPQRDNTSMLWSISGGGPEVDRLPLPPPRPLPPLPPRPRPLFGPWTNIPGVVPPESTRTCTPSCPGIPTLADTILTLFRGVSVPVPGE